jgi:hypothetical protein
MLHTYILSLKCNQLGMTEHSFKVDKVITYSLHSFNAAHIYTVVEMKPTRHDRTFI